MVLTGQTGPAGDGDIDDIDEGTSSMIRQLWNANELPTDEAHCIWGDAGIPEFNHNAWSDSHPMMKALYYRLTSESRWPTPSSNKRRARQVTSFSPKELRHASSVPCIIPT